MAIRSATINIMERAARKAARGLVRDFGEVEQLQVSKKGPSDFVSTADFKAEQILRTELKKSRPEFGLLMEESGEERGDGRHRFIVDPLDGTANFLHGIPHFAISIGLERDGEIVAGVILEPIKDELYWTEKGVGAYVNDHRLRVSARDKLPECLIGTGIPFHGYGEHDAFFSTFAAVMPEVAGIRRMGTASLDLAYIAAGRFDGFWEFGLKPWDIAAGVLLVREAGGYVSEIDGGTSVFKSGNVLATNDKLHKPLGDILRKAHGSIRRPKSA